MLSNIDIAIIVAYLLIVVVIGVVVSRKTETGEDLFLGGRSLTWGVIGLSLFASNISSTTLIGLAGAAYSVGIVHSVWEFGAGLPFIILAIFFVPLYLRAKITTVPEFLEGRFDRRSRLIFSGITIVTSIVVDTAGGLYAGSLVLQTFFPNISLTVTCFALAIFAGVYTAFGGLKAVVYTDSVQAIILLVGCSILTYLMFQEINFSWSALVSNAPDGHFSLIRPLGDAELPWTGILMGVPFLGFWYVATNQYITQRILGARSIQHARWGIMLAAMLKMTPFFIMILPGAMAIILFPGITETDKVFPTIVLEVLPVGVVGLVMAGLISAIMSSVDSTLNSASTLIVVDFIKTKKKEISGQALARYGRISTFVLMVIAALWAPNIQHFGGLWSYLQQMFSIIVPPVVVIFVMGAFYKRGTGAAAFWTLIIGFAAGALTFVLNQLDLWPIHYLETVFAMFAFLCILFIVISANTTPPSQEVIKRFTFRKEMAGWENEGVVWYKNYFVHSAVVILCMASMFVFFF